MKGIVNGLLIAATMTFVAGCSVNGGQPMARTASHREFTKQGTRVPATKAQRIGSGTQFVSEESVGEKPASPVNIFGHLPDTVAPGRGSMDQPDNEKQVSFAVEGSDFDPEIDGTGKWMAFASTRHREKSDIYLQRINGTAVTQLTSDPANDVMPTFSPDGKRIAFASDRGGNWDIYIKDANGGQAVQLTSNPTHDLHPGFSPDGTKLIYCTYGSQSGQWELVVIDLNQPSNKRFVGFGLFPNWSPTGNKIVFQRARERRTRWFSVWTIDLEDGEGVRPTEVAVSANAAAITPHWSPDGKFIVFCTVVNPASDEQKQPKQADIWVVGADGRGRVNLTNSPFANVQPVWAPSGSIHFVSNRAKAGVENIWAINPNRALMTLKQSMGGNSAITKAAAGDVSQPINQRGAAPVNDGDANRTAVVPTNP
jgi:TolB protein